MLTKALILCLLSQQIEADKFSAEQQQSIVKAHNDFRRTLAKGQVRGKDDASFPEAANMNELVWNSELEEEAEEWSKNCKFDNPEHMDYGQNLAGASPYYSPNEALTDKSHILPTIFKEWWGEYETYPADVKFTFSMDTGHFTQMAWANSKKIGCAVHNCTNGQDLFGTSDWTFTVCNYLPRGNLRKQDIYKAGSSCSDCDTCNNGLCKNGESQASEGNGSKPSKSQDSEASEDTSGSEDSKDSEEKPFKSSDLEDSDDTDF
ncbi:unnamed protein product [Bursaphelenchus okinawaensis]|uniref:SCP domain-containing protein n=1 Tax=Bursaphelenchus okinawaensis TaxID=465554 RepID=A0A811LL63_9BILA|nr:unnamed protein product [Bursaphelenchus okinawaensis]CAG9127718.1 unnamed protein product [Bursaphelenchus okinawaensis]